MYEWGVVSGYAGVPLLAKVRRERARVIYIARIMQGLAPRYIARDHFVGGFSSDFQERREESYVTRICSKLKAECPQSGGPIALF